MDVVPRDLIDRFFAMSRLLAGQLDFRSAIQAVAAEVAQVLPHDHMDVCILQGDGRFHTAYESGVQTGWGQMAMGPVQNSPIRALLAGEVDHMIAADACNDPRFDPAAADHRPIFDHGLRSRLHVPMKVHGEIIGALSCSLTRPGAYDDDHLRRARFIADLLSPYFFALRSVRQAQEAQIVEAEARAREEGLRLGALRLTEALEAERQRIGMDLHDQTLADLTRLVRRLERLPQAGPVNAQTLDPVTRGLHACMQDLRQIIEQAKPSVLQLFGFAHAVENQLERSVRDSGTPICWTLADDSGGAFDRLDQKVSVALFRILQEAVNNAVHHADPQRITVRLMAGPGGIGVSVADDGKGLPAQDAGMGSGIDNMMTRARLISAQFRLDRGPGGVGTEVAILLPRPAVPERTAAA